MKHNARYTGMVLGALNNREWEWIWNEMQKSSIWSWPAVDTGMKDGMEYRLEPNVEWKIEWGGNGMEK